MQTRFRNALPIIIAMVSIFSFVAMSFDSASARTKRLTRLQDVSDYILSDTAYVDEMEHIDNQADSVVVSGHTFKGPGPFTVHFEVEMAHKPDYFAWEIAEDSKFQMLLDCFRTLEYDSLTSRLDYEFVDQGSYYVRFVADFYESATDTATYETEDPYEVTISTSLLEVPNLITPDSPSGSNQVFKVKYQSLRSFEMWVYNRWGQELFHTTDPSEGWDGKHNGSTVPTGAYYYVIKAMGTDDQKYSKKGAINVLKTKNSSNR